MRWKKLCVFKRGGGIGFRDLWDFNLALLSKQGWRLLTQLECLMTRLMRAKCFDNGSFMDAMIKDGDSKI